MTSFDAWLTETQDRRTFLDHYGKTGAGLGLDINKAIELAHEAQNLRDRAFDYLVGARKVAMFEVRQKYGDMTSRERDIIEKDAVRPVQIILDDCETTLQSCTKRYFSRR